jgi:hypothetical protein
MNNPTLLVVGILAAVAMLSAALVVLPIQEASAQDTNFTFEQRQSNRCSGSASCSNAASITFLPGHGSPGGS